MRFFSLDILSGTKGVTDTGMKKQSNYIINSTNSIKYG